MMATNHFLGARQPFDDSSMSEQEFQALQSSFYTQSPCSFPQDNLQQLQQNHYYLSEQNSSFNGFDESCMSMPPPPPLEADMDSFGLGVSHFSHPSNHGYFYDYTHSQTPDIFYNGANGTAACPRSWQQSYGPRMMEGLSLSDVSSHYHLREQHHGLPIDAESSQNFYHRQASMSRTPPSLPDAMSCKAEDDAEEDAVSNNEEGKTEEPYAKLIHRALMGAPNYSMALQEIYQWFIDNTEKGSSSGSGWRNSIRHNLSMNAAFRKTDRAATSSPSDTPPKKTSEWVLEPWAITNGVTPTTRYRKTISKKSSSSARAESQLSVNASRQTAGKKGGNMAWRTKALRLMSQQQQQSRGACGEDGPGDRDRERDVRRDRKRVLQQQRSRVTPPREEQQQRAFSPCTPTAAVGVAGPYYLKHSPFEGVMDMAVYDMGHVQGVYTGEEGPLFSHDGLTRFRGEGDEFMWPAMQSF